MEKIVTYETLRRFAYSNDGSCTRPIRGIVLNFYGLGANGMKNGSEWGDEFAKQGVILLEPYYNPWSWMNDLTVSFVDELIDVLFDAYRLPEGTPIVSTGFSMGGLASLVYARYAARTPKACVSNCPVCDLVYHFGEREDLPRTLYSAFHHYDMTLEEALKTASPLHLVPSMPDIGYHIFHCGADQAVNIDRHSRRFVSAMLEAGKRIELRVCPGQGHCQLTPEMTREYHAVCLAEIGI